MKFTVKRILCTFFLVYNVQVNAQTFQGGLKVGDKLPSFKIPKMINAEKMSRDIDTYRNQLLIIDFWATNCSGCIEALPRFSNLQNSFKGKVTILPVTYENSDAVSRFLSSNKYTKNIKIASVVEDQVFKNLFRHKFIPHEVWVMNGIIVAITDSEYVNEEMINNVLLQKPISWPIKYDFYPFDEKKPIFELNKDQVNTANTQVEYSAISDAEIKYNTSLLPGRSGIVRDSINHTVRSFFVNQSILGAYIINLLKVTRMESLIKPTLGLDPNNIVWEVEDKSKYTDELTRYKQQWMLENGICYESITVDTGQCDSIIYRNLISDLNRLLGLNVRWERRNQKVLSIHKLESLGTKALPAGNSGYKFTIDQLCFNLNQEKNNPYVFNEDADGKADVYMQSHNWNDINGVKKDLVKNGFDIIEEERLVDKLIFTEINGNYLVDAKVQTEYKNRLGDQIDMKDPTNSENESFLKFISSQQGIIRTSSGLQYQIASEGNGRRPAENDLVVIDYEGTLVNGKIFDSSFQWGKPQTVKVDDMIAGIKEALQLMRVGARYKIYVPADLAYGNHTAQGKIPRNSNLIFDIKLLKIKAD